MKKVLPIAAIGAGLYLLYRYLGGKKTALQNLKVSPISVAIDSPKSAETGFSMLFYKIKLRFTNIEQQPVYVRFVDLDVFFQNVNIAKISRDQDFIVSGRNGLTVELEAVVQSANVVTKIVEMIQQGKLGNLSLTIVGSVGTDLGDIPIKFTKRFA